jgi:molybdopterin/thiamine biosynthesis adenylyltransferase
MPRLLREIRRRRISGRSRRAGLRWPGFVPAVKDPASRLRKLRGVIVGGGSIGREVVLHAARSGVGQLTLADPKKFKEASLDTHSILPPALGQSKALFTARQCKDINPSGRVFAHAGCIEELPLTVLADADFCVLATDNLAVEVFVGQRCLSLGVPLWQASVHGDTLVAQVRHFRNADGSGPCPRCLYGRDEVRQLDQSLAFSCEGGVAGHAARRLAETPTMSVSSLCAFAASMLHLELLKHFLGLGNPAEDCLIEHCASTRRVVVATLRRNPACPCDHARWERRRAPRALGRCSLRELADAAGFQPASFEVDELLWAEPPFCACPSPAGGGRFLPGAGNGGPRCPRCRAQQVAQPFFSRATVPVSQFGPALAQPLARLGTVAPRWVIARRDPQAALFLASNSSRS